MVEPFRPPRRFRQPSVIPGFGLAFGYTLTCLGLIVLLPLAVAAVRDWTHLLLALPQHRLLSAAAARVLAGELREAAQRRHVAALGRRRADRDHDRRLGSAGRRRRRSHMPARAAGRTTRK